MGGNRAKKTRRNTHPFSGDAPNTCQIDFMMSCNKDLQRLPRDPDEL
jgi:hypothetical protein